MHDFGTAGERDGIGQSVEVSLPGHEPFGGRPAMLEADAGQKSDDTDLANEQAMNEVRDRGANRSIGTSHKAGVTWAEPPRRSISRTNSSPGGFRRR